ncbi:hypothetical protein CKA32_004507 [Geitlerinema sp. FC II]|nr:hypothetical protein CKA32_004507 [Geitlerinema sp. FC II]
MAIAQRESKRPPAFLKYRGFGVGRSWGNRQSNCTIDN